MSEWQDISTAPKDGTRVVLWRPPARVGRWAEIVIAEFFEGSWTWPDGISTTHGEWTEDDLLDGFHDNKNFTHWMPLPDPPQ